MEQAIRAVVYNKSSCKTATGNSTTPYNHNIISASASQKGMVHFQPLFSYKLELELAKYIQDKERRLFGLSPIDVG